MRAYVNDKGVPPCKVSQPDLHCSAKEQEYIKSWSAKDAAAVSAELARLDKMRDAKGVATGLVIVSFCYFIVAFSLLLLRFALQRLTVCCR